MFLKIKLTLLIDWILLKQESACIILSARVKEIHTTEFGAWGISQSSHRQPTHHGDLVSLDADVGASEVAQSCDSSNAGSIHQVAIMIQHVNIHSDLPHLTTDTHTGTGIN